MGTVSRLRPASAVTVRAAAAAYLATIDHPESRGTHRVYAGILRALCEEFGDLDATHLEPAAVAEWFARRYGTVGPSRWNVAKAALGSAREFWQQQGWLTADPVSMLARRTVVPDRDRALSRGQVEQLLTDEQIPLRERLLWRMLYESAARSAEVLRLDVEDLDFANRRSRVRRKGGAVDIIVWQTGTARLLPRYLKGRTTGPVFVTERKSRDPLPPGDLEPDGRARLSYERAEELFKKHSGGATLHQLRHSVLSHDADDGTSTMVLMARSGHTSVRSLAKYARVSAEALQRHQEQRDPARRR
jgi:integrase/recombinase XerC/integrase/recombinase XerD